MGKEIKYRVIGFKLQVQKADKPERLKRHNGLWRQKVPTVVIESECWECYTREQGGAGGASMLRRMLKKAAFSPAQPRRAETRRSAGKAATSEEAKAYASVR